MKEFIMNLPVQGRMSIAIMITAVLIIAVIMRMRKITLEEMMGCAYKEILKAEKIFNEPGTGEKKMNWVVGMVKESIPLPMRLWFSDEFIRKTIQIWFDLVKDLLEYEKGKEEKGE